MIQKKNKNCDLLLWNIDYPRKSLDKSDENVAGTFDTKYFKKGMLTCENCVQNLSEIITLWNIYKQKEWIKKKLKTRIMIYLMSKCFYDWKLY